MLTNSSKIILTYLETHTIAHRARILYGSWRNLHSHCQQELAKRTMPRLTKHTDVFAKFSSVSTSKSLSFMDYRSRKWEQGTRILISISRGSGPCSTSPCILLHDNLRCAGTTSLINCKQTMCETHSCSRVQCTGAILSRAYLIRIVRIMSPMEQ